MTLGQMYPEIFGKTSDKPYRKYGKMAGNMAKKYKQSGGKISTSDVKRKNTDARKQ